MIDPAASIRPLTRAAALLLIAATACGGRPPTAPAEEVHPEGAGTATPAETRSLGTLVGPADLPVPRGVAGEGACWQEQPCPNEDREDGMVCVTSDAILCGAARCREVAREQPCESSATCAETHSCLVAEAGQAFGRTEPYPQCRATPCGSHEDCRTSNGTCGASGVCERRQCASTDGCPDGYCIGGRCFAEPGSCTPRNETMRP